MTRAPPDLSPSSAVWWRSVVKTYQLEAHHLHMLTVACRALDRAEQAREALAVAGTLTFQDDRGMVRVRPEVAIERDARTAYARLLREPDLDVVTTPERSRPPALRSGGLRWGLPMRFCHPRCR